MKLLLADDEPDMIRALSAILTHEGYKVDAVYDGAEALEKAAAVSYDGLILDIMMPKLDGFSACKEIKKEKDVPVIMMSARGEGYPDPRSSLNRQKPDRGQNLRA